MTCDIIDDCAFCAISFQNKVVLEQKNGKVYHYNISSTCHASIQIFSIEIPPFSFGLNHHIFEIPLLLMDWRSSVPICQCDCTFVVVCHLFRHSCDTC